MPESFATRCGAIESSKHASMIEAEIEVVAAAGAQRRYRALVVAVGIAELVLRQTGMMEFRLGDVSHDTTLPLRSGVTLSASRRSAMALAMNRAVIGEPS